MVARTAEVYCLTMAHPGDVSELAGLIASGKINPHHILAILGKTEGNGGVNDFTRGYFTQSMMALLASTRQQPAADLLRTIPCILSGGTEGVLTPHYTVFCAREGEATAAGGALAIGTAFSPPLEPEHLGRAGHCEAIRKAVLQAMENAGITRAEDVCLVQVKAPCLTTARVDAARQRGIDLPAMDSGRSMALARAAGAFGVALALGEIADIREAAMLSDFTVTSNRASISSGIEVEANEVIVLGHSPAWSGPLRMASGPFGDPLDLAAMGQVFSRLGLSPSPQLSPADQARLKAVIVKGEPDRRGHIRGRRHTMLDDTDINAQRHLRGALGAIVASITGDSRIFVSGGAEHQGPDGGGLVAVIASEGM